MQVAGSIKFKIKFDVCCLYWSCSPSTVLWPDDVKRLRCSSSFDKVSSSMDSTWLNCEHPL